MILNWLIERQNMTPIDLLMEQIDVVLEKTSHGTNVKMTDDVVTGRGLNNILSGNEISASSNDVLDARVKHHLETFDKKKNDYLIASKNICEDYRKVCEADFDYIVSTIDDYTKGKMSTSDMEKVGEDIGITTLDGELCANFRALTSDENPNKLTKEEAKRQLVDSFYYKDGDAKASPENIRNMLKMRSNYNKRIMKSLENMLRLNYSILGITGQEADVLIQGLKSGNQSTIKDVKKLVEANKSKFVSNGKMDLRSLGYGVIFMTKEDMGAFGTTISLDNCLQWLMRYDCIVAGHGNSTNLSQKQLDELDDVEGEYSPLASYRWMKQNCQSEIDRYLKFKQDLKKINILTSKAVDIHMPNIIEEDSQTISRRLPKSIKHLGVISLIIQAALTSKERASERGAAVTFQPYKNLPDDIRKQYDKYKVAPKSKTEWGDKTSNPVVLFRDDTMKQLHNKSDVIESETAISNKSYSTWEKLYDWCIEFEKFFKTDFSEVVDEIQDIEKSKDTIRNTRTEILEHPDRDKFYWYIQPVSTDKGGPFSDMNDLLRQVIKEGHKNILVLSCNVGRHSLDPSIANAKGVHIHHAKYEVIGESCQISDEHDSDTHEMMQPLFEAEEQLRVLAESCDINYDDNSHLVATYESVMESEEFWDDSVVLEGVGGKIWDTIVALAKKLIEALIALFKAIIEFIKKIIMKIASIFSGKKDEGKSTFKQKQKVSFIALESAHVVQKDIGSYEDLKKFIEKSNQSIAKEVNRVSTRQTKLAKDMQDFSQKQQNKYQKVGA